MGCNSIHCVKGWTRGCALHMSVLLLKLEGCVEKFKAMMGADRLAGFATQHVNFVAVGEAVDVVDLNRGTIF